MVGTEVVGIDVQANRRSLIAALRSGEFLQTRGRLRRTFDFGFAPVVYSYCAIGVACENHRRQTGKGTWEGDTRRPQYRPLSAKEWDEWYGMTRALVRELVLLNDYEGFSFERIADFLEERWEQEQRRALRIERAQALPEFLPQEESSEQTDTRELVPV